MLEKRIMSAQTTCCLLLGGISAQRLMLTGARASLQSPPYAEILALWIATFVLPFAVQKSTKHFVIFLVLLGHLQRVPLNFSSSETSLFLFS